MPANTVTLDREIVERFIVEADALATFDSILHGHTETWLVEHIYGIIEPFEKAALGRMSDEASTALHERGRELAREVFRPLFTEAAAPVIQELAAGLEEVDEDG